MMFILYHKILKYVKKYFYFFSEATGTQDLGTRKSSEAGNLAKLENPTNPKII